MSARSPRSSLSASSDIALDFAESLKDLQQNTRWEISNLTTIARESTEHAQAISRVLLDHINNTVPSKKLVALYVLDSIIKNVGTPYTVYLTNNLFDTFFNTYRVVDANTRRAMESLLKTWREPIPGSIDSRPVLMETQTRPLDTALMKWKTIELQHQQSMPPQQIQRTVATPPQYGGHPPMPQMSQPQYQQHPQYNYGQQPTPQPQIWAPPYHPPTPQQFQPGPVTPVQYPPVDVNTLMADIASFRERLQANLAADRENPLWIGQLNAVRQLQNQMYSGTVTGSDLHQVKDTISALSSRLQAPTAAAPEPAAPQWAPAQVQQTSTPFPPPAPVNYQYQPPQPVTLPFMQPQNLPPPQSMPSMFPPGALNGLQALLANGQRPSTPQMRAAAPILQSAPHSQLSNMQQNVTAAPPNNAADLLAALTKSGVLSSLASATPATPPVPPKATAPSAPSTATLLQSLSSILPQSQAGTPTLPPTQLAGAGKPRIPMLTSELKAFRPELVRALYQDQPNQCSTCGRRFLATEEGRAKKQRHLDWHFRTNQRMADPNTSRGQHRQWFVDEVEWISTPEFDPSTASAAETAESTATAQKAKQKGPGDQFIRAPAGITRFTCSICQEEMKSSFSEALQDWVFMNATYFNGKPAHATCVDEMKRPFGGVSGAGALAAALSGGERQRSVTPESALGKRKAEGVLAGHGAKMRNA
ncbi:hypothetical protein LTR62_001710 [Meristemomyces frigidus]|uniref:CID domain-containing protein n=1 Tax=Meristemomyces frigidus TaxID=1508187 RepID=A0AAN7TFH6_9PEZI|nr:hypothetical protein LTR62_001710 [Meristemomyces frigidus]